jgi:hypothetical protein
MQGKRHEMPCHHNLETYLHAYLDGSGGVGSNCTPAKKSSTTDTGLFLRERPPWGIPDGVYSCEEVA